MSWKLWFLIFLIFLYKNVYCTELQAWEDVGDSIVELVDDEADGFMETEDRNLACFRKSTIDRNQFTVLKNSRYPKVTLKKINCYYKVTTPIPTDQVYIKCKLRTLKIPDGKRCRLVYL